MLTGPVGVSPRVVDCDPIVIVTFPGGDWPALQPMEDTVAVTDTGSPGREGLGEEATSSTTGPPLAARTTIVGLVAVNLPLPPMRPPAN